MGENEERVVGATTQRSVRVSSRSGRVEVVAEPRSDVVALKGGKPIVIDDSVDRVTVSSRSSRLELRVPEGTDVVIGTVSGTVDCIGPLGHVAVNTVSARITIEHAARVDARSVSGVLKVTTCDGEVRCDVISGRADIGTAGSVMLSTKSGRITARQVRGKVRARSVTGRIKVGVTEVPLDVEVGCISGRIQVRVPRGARPGTRLTTRSGRVTNQLDEGDDGFVSARTVSGRILIDEAP
jgi:hypothetical protein